jgi:outer membrane protein assembly factor BamB
LVAQSAAGGAVAADTSRGQRNSLVVLNAATGAAVVTVPLGAVPLRVAYGAQLLGGRAGRAFSSRGRSSHRIRSPWKIGDEPFDITVGGGAAWIPDHDGAKLWRLDLKTGQTTASAVVDGPELASACAFGAAWVVGADRVLRRFDPR